MGWWTAKRCIAEDRLIEFSRALRGEDYDHLRCPNCETRHLTDTGPTEWTCPQCGSIDTLRTTVAIACPYCGGNDIEIDWRHDVITCPDCGLLEQNDLQVTLGR